MINVRDLPSRDREGISRGLCAGTSTQAESRKGVGGLWPSFARSIIFRRNSVTCAYASTTAARHRAPGLTIRNVGKVRVKGCCSRSGTRTCKGSAGTTSNVRVRHAEVLADIYDIAVLFLTLSAFKAFTCQKGKAKRKGLANIFHVLETRLGKFIRRDDYMILHYMIILFFWDYFVYLLRAKSKILVSLY